MVTAAWLVEAERAMAIGGSQHAAWNSGKSSTQRKRPRVHPWVVLKITQAAVPRLFPSGYCANACELQHITRDLLLAKQQRHIRGQQTSRSLKGGFCCISGDAARFLTAGRVGATADSRGFCTLFCAREEGEVQTVWGSANGDGLGRWRAPLATLLENSVFTPDLSTPTLHRPANRRAPLAGGESPAALGSQDAC